MAVSLSKDSQLSIGVSETLIGVLLSWDTSEADTQVDVSNFDSQRREFVNIDNVDRDVNIEAHFDLSDAGHDQLRTVIGLDTSRVFTIYPDGKISGNKKLSTEIYVASLSVSASGIEDVITASFGGKILALTESIIP